MNIEEAKTNLDDSLIAVARLAQDVADGAQHHKLGYIVDPEDMDELKKAIKEWKAATADFLLAVQKAGG